MKIYQCIHKYPPHILQFEERYGVTDDMDFDTLRRLVLEDGYASAYILLPALQQKSDEVFYTIWNYERLQHCWAREYGLKTKDLNKIKLAQIEEYKPDVFYNLSPFCDKKFIKKLGKRNDRKDVCWNGIIEPIPKTFSEYDGHLSLHRPYIEYWKRHGFASCELQPAISADWTNKSVEKNIDVLFYGQYMKSFFRNRNKIIDSIIDYKQIANCDIQCRLMYTEKKLVLFKIPKISWSKVQLPITVFPVKKIRENALPPLFGSSLYDAISKARIVINAYTDNNVNFKSNMRLFEAIGHGAFLISEEGSYPDGFEPGIDFYIYRNSDELIRQIELVLSDWPAHVEIARRTQRKIATLYSKERQWNDFVKFVSSI